MRYFKDGIEITGELTIGDIVYPHIWWADPEQRELRGVTGVPEPEQPAPTLEEIAINLAANISFMTAKIKAERDRRKFGGVFVSEKWIHTDADSRTQWLALVLMGANIPANVPWTTHDGTEIVLTQSLAGAVFAATATLDITAFAVSKSHIAAMEASATPENYDYSAGWPAIYSAI